MAGDWIKMRTDLYRDPKVCLIADRLLDSEGALARYVSQNMQRNMSVTRNVMRNVTVGALVTLWGVTRHRGKRIDDDLLVRSASISVVDDIADLPGFGEAMESVGWVIQTDEGIVFPHFFEEFNVEPGMDQKQANAERQKRYREKRNALRNVTVTSQSNAREEKNRGEKSTDTKVSVSSDFEVWYSSYPKKVGKDAAAKAYAKAMRLIAPAELLQASLPRFAQLAKRETQYIPNPASWLNSGGWKDELSAIAPKTNSGALVGPGQVYDPNADFGSDF
jgi:hypothetical protein